MADATFGLGDRVTTLHGRGTIIDVRPTPTGAWVFGVEDANGEVRHYTASALRPENA